jgi:hypothetical protein
MTFLKEVYGLGFLLVLCATVAAGDDTPKPKSDAEQLVGDWVRPFGPDVTKDKRMILFSFKDNGHAQLLIFQLINNKDEKTHNLPGGGWGFSYKLGTRGKKKVLLFDDFIGFEGKKAEIEYEFVDGKLRLGTAKMQEHKDLAELDFKGEYSRPKFKTK